MEGEKFTPVEFEIFEFPDPIRSVCDAIWCVREAVSKRAICMTVGGNGRQKAEFIASAPDMHASLTAILDAREKQRECPDCGGDGFVSHIDGNGELTNVHRCECVAALTAAIESADALRKAGTL